MAITHLEILTLAEVAQYLKVAERTIYRLAAGRKIPAFKVGGAWRFSKPEIDRWINRESESKGIDRKRSKVRHG
jgi:excisionase family DNA binding protein